MELEYVFRWPLSYPQALLDSVQEELQPVIKGWACRALEALQRQFLTYPERSTAMLLEGMGTSQQIAGEPVCVFLAMAIHRKDAFLLRSINGFDRCKFNRTITDFFAQPGVLARLEKVFSACRFGSFCALALCFIGSKESLES
jgi:hypothetical protein